MSDPLSGTDLERCEALAERVAGGDTAAWAPLAEALWPALQTLVRSSRSMGPLRRSEDDVRDVVTDLLEKLGSREGRGLLLHRSWRARHPDKTFADWLRIVATNAVRDHVRARRGRPEDDGLPSVKRLLNEFSGSAAVESLGVRPPMTAAQTARQLLAFAHDQLPADQRAALSSWLEGASFEEIRAEVGASSAEEAARLVRAAVAVLRRRFAPA